jgi:hypothetical protein
VCTSFAIYIVDKQLLLGSVSDKEEEESSNSSSSVSEDDKARDTTDTITKLLVTLTLALVDDLMM